MATRWHSRTHFYKFATADVAKLIIASRSFQWSAPTKFNDPFDHRTEFLWTATPEEYAAAVGRSMVRVVFGPDEPRPGPPANRIYAMLIETRTGLRRNRGATPESFLRAMHEVCLEAGQRMPEMIRGLNQKLVHHMCRSRVFCMTETANNVVMWSHYAKSHTGVAFKLRCIDEIDNVFLIAEPVQYEKSFHTLGCEQFANHWTGESPLEAGPWSRQLTRIKHLDWKYEREWRIFQPLNGEEDGEGVTLKPEDPRSFEAIVLGLDVGTSDAREIEALVREHLPGTAVVRARRSTRSFDLEFDGDVD